jgi:delta14-sterol reductase
MLDGVTGQQVGCLCACFLVDNLEPMPVWEAVALTVLFALGFWLFRGANEQKHRFKEDPTAVISGRPATAIGGTLLVSGFWGIGPKLNYTGELIVYLAFALTTGHRSFVPFILPLWLGALFVHRAWRDEQRCAPSSTARSGPSTAAAHGSG